jgi:ATP-dependent Clp protease ATP-binding subunit ClpA
MFERFNEQARRSLFFARVAAGEGGAPIEPEHLVLGILRAAPGAIMQFVRPNIDIETVREYFGHVHAAVMGEQAYHAPFSDRMKRVLEHAQVEADEAGHRMIRPEHLLLAVMVKGKGDVPRRLHDLGVDVAAIRDHLVATPDAPVRLGCVPPAAVVHDHAHHIRVRACEYRIAMREAASTVRRDLDRAARELMQEVNAHLPSGWIPQGGITSIHAGGGIYLMQALVRR